MTPEQQRQFVAAVDELRRLQLTTRRPPNAHEQKALAEAAQIVDNLLARWREPDPDTIDTHLAPPEQKV